MTDKQIQERETMRHWLDEMRDMNNEWCKLAHELKAVIIARDEEIAVLKAMLVAQAKEKMQ